VLQNTLLAAMVGGMLAAGVAFLVEYMDDTVKDPADVEAVGLSVMAAVQRVRSRGNGRLQSLVTVDETQSALAEAYRTLRTNLQFSSLDRPLRSLAVASAVASEGKTTTAANLAVVMAQMGKRVVLVDGDLRRPAVHRAFGLPNKEGLTEALRESPDTLNGYLQQTAVENLRVMTSGQLPPNPQELLGSQRMEALLHTLEEEVDLVVVDTPAALPVADASLLATRTDGVLMVVDAGETRRTALYQATGGLEQVGANLLGIVLNKVDLRGAGGYYASYYYSGYGGDGTGPRGGVRGWLERLGRRPWRGRRKKGEAA
jgi:capsular exopolysaccharide synthesis family protein